MRPKNLLLIVIAFGLFFPTTVFGSTVAPGSKTTKYVSYVKEANTFSLSEKNTGVVPVIISANDFEGVKMVAEYLQEDIRKVTGTKPELLQDELPAGKNLVIIGTLGQSKLIDELVAKNKIDIDDIKGNWESSLTQVVENPFPNVDKALVIAGSDKRGTIFGMLELSQQIGVSPWYWWADVPVKKQENIFVKSGRYIISEPKVKYRGIFLNDEEPALGNWTRENFGDFNQQFYEKVFELILRLRGNFLWPAMWGKAFYDDDPQNAVLADKLGIVINTTHHEPLGRAHVEWERYGTGPWDYSKNEKVLKAFWREGMERCNPYEKFITVGMRGDGDEAMTEDTNIALLEQVVKDQREIISDVTGKKPEETPQVWALYKEVQDYYDKGMRVPDDVTLLLCDDNWGDVRKLPAIDAPKHKGGYGMYYHFDYVGAPRNYKWINVTQIQRVWEQMNLTYSHGVDKIWVVNVGDLKPMEFPISFFLDMAWEPEQFNPDNLLEYTKNWCADQFGEPYAAEAARIINQYTKYNHRVTPELLNADTYSLENYNEFERERNNYRDLALDALRLYNLIPNDTKDAFDQLVLYPTNATSNLYEMYYAQAMNKKLAAQNNPAANDWADEVIKCYQRDSILTIHYNQQIADGKWNHMMDQVRIGYTYWQQPDFSKCPEVQRVEVKEIPREKLAFAEADGFVSIQAENYQLAISNDKINWKVIPDLGKTGSAITTLPQNVYPAEGDEIYLEYAVKFSSTGDCDVSVLVSPTLNFNANKGLRYAISFDGGPEQVVNINEAYRGELGPWQANRIIETTTKHKIENAGLHRLRIRVLEPGIVLQKILIDTGGLKPSYLGAPESKQVKIEE
ncbi:glycosyl hydrolase 115 family protein [Draconibacterium sp. IB214405]|uniref:glycosyl hydrolase 115 family protein n=1 Tax=Draconibacterium sp. IB214405 TaxID=3097352 RepID=UPI002A153BB9|nr:glycosyl hydrolase 115 family protein [Draconibacterium sp. IB214405]MDX8339602.1 glycosyl hydrolase 115 family protein [Draconibacterium sp. IB214405]